jgi:hypothetical protein
MIFSYFEDAVLRSPMTAGLIALSYVVGVFVCTKLFSLSSSTGPRERLRSWDIALGIHNAILCVFSMVMFFGLARR